MKGGDSYKQEKRQREADATALLIESLWALPTPVKGIGKSTIRAQESTKLLGNSTHLQGRNTDFIIFDDYQGGQVETEVRITGGTVVDAKRAMAEHCREPLLTIDVVRNYHQDPLKLPGCRAYPSDRFVIRWNGDGENFTREVIGLKELNSVVQPIIKAHVDAKRLVDKQNEKSRLEYEQRAKLARKENAKLLRKQAQELLRRADAIESGKIHSEPCAPQDTRGRR